LSILHIQKLIDMPNLGVSELLTHYSKKLRNVK
jgi:hypothetical protein